MRKLIPWMAALLWALVAVLMPMSALEPVGTAHAAAVPAAEPLAAAACDGGARLAMGCESMHL
jgi:hypothetical protein